VAEQFYSSYSGNVSLDIFETVMPPFNKCLLEFQGGGREFAVGFEDRQSLEVEDMAVAVDVNHVSDVDHIKLNARYPGIDFVWVVSTRWLFTEATERGINVMPEDFSFYLNCEGRLVRSQSGALLTAGCAHVVQEILTRQIGIFICPVLFALTLMHCKNVNLATVTTPLPLSMKKSKRRKQISERKKYPPFERHTIVIRDRKGRVVQTGQRLEGAAKGLHWVRGHFHTYTPERPLFGNPKLHGRYWVPAHIAGLNPERVIESDYLLEVA
jgi:hypothetical protein